MFSIRFLLILLSIMSYLNVVHNIHNNNDPSLNRPVTEIINTPNGPQYITRQVLPDGSFYLSSNGPGFSNGYFSSNHYGGPNSNFHYSGMSYGNGQQSQSSMGQASSSGNHFNSVPFGSYQGSAMAMGSGINQGQGMMMGQGMGMGSGMGMSSGMGMGMMGGFRPMKPMKFPKFEWWPSIFDNSRK